MSQPPLHRAVFLIASPNLEKARDGERLLLERLAAGDDVNALYESETALRVCISKPRKWDMIGDMGDGEIAQWEVIWKRSLGALVRAGADPWAGSPNAYSQSNCEPWVLLGLFQARNKVSHSKLNLGPDGENDLHALLALPYMVMYCSATADSLRTIKVRWLNGVDRFGNTPLHTLWKNPFGDDEWRAFELVDRLIQSGARIDIPDQNGHTMIQLVAQSPTLHAGVRAFPDLRDRLEEIRSHYHRNLMDATTPPVNTLRSRRARL